MWSDPKEVELQNVRFLAGFRCRSLFEPHYWRHFTVGCTGDLATMDYRGFIQIEGRIRDMIIRGGENVYPPREIEDALRTYPAVIEAAVVGVPDEYWGERLAAFVRLTRGETIKPEALQSFLVGRPGARSR